MADFVRSGALWVPADEPGESAQRPQLPERCKCGAAWSELGADIMETTVGPRPGPGHEHDDNCMTRYIWCANGHYFAIGVRRTCELCDWKGKEQCCGPFRYLEAWPELPVRERANVGPR